MQHEIATAEEAIRSQRGPRPRAHGRGRDLAREVKAAEAELKSQQAAIAAEQKALDTEAAALQ